MASFDYDADRKRARFFFRFRGRQYNRVEPVESRRHAERILAGIEEAILDVERGKVAIPPGADVKRFLMTGGRISGEASRPPEPAPPTVAEVFALYFGTLTAGSKERGSLATEGYHADHLKRIVGADAAFERLSLDDFQRYVDARAGEGAARETIAKEVGTARMVWEWARKRKHVAAALGWKTKELTWPKGREKPPFQTWGQIERRIARGDLGEPARAELWESLWLDQAQTLACLEWVRANATRPMVFALFAFAAYTGARRGELLRSERTDWDFAGGMVRIRQKKSDRSKEYTTRDVPIHPGLAAAMRSWFESTPGAAYAVESNGKPLTEIAATKWFRRTVDRGPWKVLRGFHVFRHSLASNMASAGVDQRVIDAVLGHSTDAMSRRYRHLLPSQRGDAIGKLFRR